jgi:hypothetical protein
MGISDAKKAADGAVIECNGSAVSAVFGDFFYVEADDRSLGIRVDKPGHALMVGVRADVAGKVSTDPNGEKFIAADTAVENGVGTITPLGLTSPVLGGGVFGFQGAVWGKIWKAVPGGNAELTWTQGSGLNNIGLLVKVFGTITQTDPSGNYFYLEDGSGIRDGTLTGQEENVGVRVASPLGSHSSGQFVTITGISSCFRGDDGKLRRLIRVQSGSDILP